MWVSEATETSGGWDWVLFWTVVAAVVGALALVGVVFAVIGYYRDHPKRQLEITIKSRRLVQSTSKVTLEVKVGGIDVPDPYLVEVRLASNSRADIASSTFDAGRNLKIRVQPGGAFVLGEGRADGGIQVSGAHGEGWDQAEFVIAPQLIRKGSTLALDFISNGTPNVMVDSPLIDVPVVDVTNRPKGREVLWAWAIVIFAALMAGLIIATPFTAPESETPLWLTIVLACIYVAMLVLAATYLVHQLRWRRR